MEGRPTWPDCDEAGDSVVPNGLKTNIPVYSTSLDQGLGTRKPIEWQRLNYHVEVQIRDYLSTDKYYLPTIIKSQVYNPKRASL